MQRHEGLHETDWEALREKEAKQSPRGETIWCVPAKAGACVAEVNCVCACVCMCVRVCDRETEGQARLERQAGVGCGGS